MRRFDVIDVERWVGEQLIDLLAFGVRSFEIAVVCKAAD